MRRGQHGRPGRLAPVLCAVGPRFPHLPTAQAAAVRTGTHGARPAPVFCTCGGFHLVLAVPTAVLGGGR